MVEQVKKVAERLWGARATDAEGLKPKRTHPLDRERTVQTQKQVQVNFDKTLPREFRGG